jgi:hypothetical protein
MTPPDGDPLDPPTKLAFTGSGSTLALAVIMLWLFLFAALFIVAGNVVSRRDR